MMNLNAMTPKEVDDTLLECRMTYEDRIDEYDHPDSLLNIARHKSCDKNLPLAVRNEWSKTHTKEHENRNRWCLFRAMTFDEVTVVVENDDCCREATIKGESLSDCIAKLPEETDGMFCWVETDKPYYNCYGHIDFIDGNPTMKIGHLRVTADDIEIIANK